MTLPSVATWIAMFAQAAPAPAAAPAPVPPPPAEAVPSPTTSTKAVVPFASVEEGIGVRTADESFSVGIHLLLQSRYQHVELDNDTRESGFRVLLARPALRGNLVRPWITYFVQWELANTPSLLDAEVQIQPIPEVGIKVGQFLTPFSREFLVPPGALLLGDFAPSNVTFRNNRDIGAMVLGSALAQHVEYFAAVVNGNGIDQGGNDNAEAEFIGRLGVNVFGSSPYTETPQLANGAPGLALGGNASFTEQERTTNLFDPATGVTQATRVGSTPVTKLGADIAFHAGPVSLQSEGYERITGSGPGVGPTVARGGFAQVGVFIVPRTLELAARGDLIDVDAGHAGPTSKRADGGIIYYVQGNNLKLQLRYAWASTRAPLPSTVETISNTIALQGQLWF